MPAAQLTRRVVARVAAALVVLLVMFTGSAPLGAAMSARTSASSQIGAGSPVTITHSAALIATTELVSAARAHWLGFATAGAAAVVVALAGWAGAARLHGIGRTHTAGRAPPAL